MYTVKILRAGRPKHGFGDFIYPYIPLPPHFPIVFQEAPEAHRDMGSLFSQQVATCISA